MKIIRKIIRRLLVVLNLLQQIIIFALCLSISLIIFANSMEIFLGKDIAYANALSVFPKMPIEVEGLVVPQSVPNLSRNLAGDYGKPITLNVPVVKRKLEIVPAIRDSQRLLTRPNNGHFLVSYDDNNQPREFAIYLNKSWRTLPEPEEIKSGTNLYIDTNRKWRYVFRIEEIVQIDYEKKFVVPHGQQTNLILIINNAKENNFLIIRGEYRTVVAVEK